MRRSKDVSLTLLTALALSSTACDNRPIEVRNCVDAQGRIVPDPNCRQHSSGGGGGYHYIYGGTSGGHDGDTVVGGSAEPEAGAKVVSGEEGVARGGLGHAGGEGEGGGGGEGAGE
jgi:hypothetical protein